MDAKVIDKFFSIMYEILVGQILDETLTLYQQSTVREIFMIDFVTLTKFRS